MRIFETVPTTQFSFKSSQTFPGIPSWTFMEQKESNPPFSIVLDINITMFTRPHITNGFLYGQFREEQLITRSPNLLRTSSPHSRLSISEKGFAGCTSILSERQLKIALSDFITKWLRILLRAPSMTKFVGRNCTGSHEGELKLNQSLESN